MTKYDLIFVILAGQPVLDFPVTPTFRYYFYKTLFILFLCLNNLLLLLPFLEQDHIIMQEEIVFFPEEC